jgi:hypothetical protein
LTTQIFVFIFIHQISASIGATLEHSFSFSIPKNKEETFKQPPKDRPVVLTVFVKNPESVNNIESAKWVINNNNQSEPIALEKISDVQYVTKPTTFPDQKFKIVVDVLDNENHKTVLVSPSKFKTIDTSK